MSYSHATHDILAVEFAIGGDFREVGLWAEKSPCEDVGA